jgi:MarR family transcriptional regulator, organic hydroperoxide resistance regulator
MPTNRQDRRDEIIASIMKYGREESRLSLMFRELIAQRFGVSATDLECVDFLIERGAATAGELATLTGLTTGAVTGIIRRLTRAGLVTAKPDPNDRRRVIVRPVQKEVKVGEALYQSFADALNDMYSHHSDGELATIAEYHRRMRDIFAAEIQQLRGTDE